MTHLETVAYAHAPAEINLEDWSVGDLLRCAVAQGANDLALIVPGDAAHTERRWTYMELLAESKKAAQALLERFAPGERVATWAGASAELVFLHCGAALAGIVLVTLNPASRPSELEYLLTQSKARGLFASRQHRGTDHAAIIDTLRAKLASLACVFFLEEWSSFVGGKDSAKTSSETPSVLPHAPAMILFTSGTTGKPKGAVLKHHGIVNNARFTTARMRVPERSVWLNVLPMFHIGGSVTMMLGCIANRGVHMLLPEFNPDTALEVLARYRVNLMMAVPTMLLGMLQSENFERTDLTNLQMIVTGGTVITPALVREVRSRFGVEVMVLFGQTEAGGCMCLTHRGDTEEQVTQSVGAPLSHAEIKVVRTDASQGGGLALREEVGEICVRSPCVMQEYFEMPEKTAETIDAEGWVHTGDLGAMRADGYLRVTGRLKDMIIRGGENIYPREIEDALATHPAIAQSAVFGLEDEKWGEQVAAAVVLNPEASADAEVLMQFLYARIARHKVPKIWHFVNSLPTNASGKIQKFALREMYSPATEHARVHSR